MCVCVFRFIFFWTLHVKVILTFCILYKQQNLTVRVGKGGGGGAEGKTKRRRGDREEFGFISAGDWRETLLKPRGYTQTHTFA